MRNVSLEDLMKGTWPVLHANLSAWCTATALMRLIHCQQAMCALLQHGTFVATEMRTFCFLASVRVEIARVSDVINAAWHIIIVRFGAVLATWPRLPGAWLRDSIVLLHRLAAYGLLKYRDAVHAGTKPSQTLGAWAFPAD